MLILRSARASRYDEVVVYVVCILGSFDWGRLPTRTSSFIFMDKGRRVTSQVKSSIWLREPIRGIEGTESWSRMSAISP